MTEIKDPFQGKSLTTTSLFLLPVFGIDNKVLSGNGFINGYIGDINETQPEGNVLFCLFQPVDVDAFNLWLDKIEDITLYDYDYEDGYVVVVLKFPKEFDADYKLITEGKYSRTSKAFQGLFPKTIEFQVDGVLYSTEHITYRVFNKLPALKKEIEEYYEVTLDKDTEYYLAFNPEKEILNILTIMEEGL